MNSDFYKMLLFLLLLLIIVCSLNFYALRRLLLDFLVGARNRKNAYKIHKEQKAKDRFTLSYIEPMIKRYTYEFRFFHRCYMVLIYYSAALCMNKHQTNILVGVLLGSLLAVAILLFPVFLMVGNEIYGRYEAKKQLNNPYINQHYVDWSKISLSPLDIQFRLPSDWTFSFEEGNHSIYDALGEEIAIFNTQAERMDVGAFVQSVTGITVSSIKRTSLQYTCFGTRVSLNELALGETAGGIIQYYELCLYDKTDPANYIRILFERDNLISDTELLKYCEAIAYSFCY